MFFFFFFFFFLKIYEEIYYNYFHIQTFIILGDVTKEIFSKGKVFLYINTIIRA